MNKKRILIFPYTHQLGTTHSLVAIANELRDLGYEIIFACSDGKYSDYIRKAGFDIEEIVDIDSETYHKFVDKSNLAYHNKESIKKFVEEEIKLIEKHKPAVVVDMIRLTLKLSAHLTKTPRVSIASTILTNYYAGERGLPESHWLYTFTKNPITRQLINKLTPKAEDFFFKKWAKPYNKYLNHKTNLKINSMKELYEGNITILMDASEFAPVLELPSSVHVVGPILHTDDNIVPDWFNKFDRAKKTIFVSMGSTGILFTKVVEYLAKMFKDSKDIQIVATTAQKHALPNTELPKNFYTTDYVPAGLILSQNCILTIIHGGRGSIYHSLENGVPMIGIPHHAEQEWNINSVEELGLGKKVSAKRLNFNDFSEAVLDILENPKFGSKAKDFQKILKNYTGDKTAAKIIHESIVGTK